MPRGEVQDLGALRRGALHEVQEPLPPLDVGRRAPQVVVHDHQDGQGVALRGRGHGVERRAQHPVRVLPLAAPPRLERRAVARRGRRLDALRDRRHGQHGPQRVPRQPRRDHGVLGDAQPPAGRRAPQVAHVRRVRAARRGRRGVRPQELRRVGGAAAADHDAPDDVPAHVRRERVAAPVQELRLLRVGALAPRAVRALGQGELHRRGLLHEPLREHEELRPAPLRVQQQAGEVGRARGVGRPRQRRALRRVPRGLAQRDARAEADLQRVVRPELDELVLRARRARDAQLVAGAVVVDGVRRDRQRHVPLLRRRARVVPLDLARRVARDLVALFDQRVEGPHVVRLLDEAGDRGAGVRRQVGWEGLLEPHGCFGIV